MANDDLYFSFTLGNGMFAVPVTFVKEVFDFTTRTPVPNSLEYLLGVMNIRGSVVPIVDLRKLFNFNTSVDVNSTSVIDIELPRNGEKPFEFAILADMVDVVTHLNMIPAGSVSYGIPADQKDFVRSVARQGENFILVLDLDKIIKFIISDVEKVRKSA